MSKPTFEEFMAEFNALANRVTELENANPPTPDPPDGDPPDPNPADPFKEWFSDMLGGENE